MKHIITALIFCCLATPLPTHCMLPSCAAPIDYATTTVITLTSDIIIDTECELVRVPGAGPISITFTAPQVYKIIVTKNGIWDLQTFNAQDKILQFAGFARLEVQKGGTIRFNGGTLVMTENSTFFFP